MRNSNDEESSGAFAREGAAVDFGLALVVASSPVNRVVVCRIAEQAGLRTVGAPMDQARQALSGPLPALVILDVGADDHDCAELLDHIARLRRPVPDRQVPLVIALHNRTTPPLPQEDDSPVDAVVTKPVTLDTLQPVIRQMIAGLRHPR